MMRRTRPEELAALRRLLRDADPAEDAEEQAAGELGSSVRRARLRARMLAEAAGAPRPLIRPWRWAMASALGVIVCLGAAWVARRGVEPESAASPSPVTVTAPTAAATEAGAAALPAARRERRQMQFETPGGTRIIWVLDPELRL